MKNVFLLISFLITMGLGGCGLDGVEDPGEETRTIDGIDYKVQGNQVTQLTGERKSWNILVMADIHGCLNQETDLINQAAGRFDCVVLLGDYISLWNLSETHYTWIYSAIDRAAQTGKPVFVLNGNHDNQLVFELVLSDLAKIYSNIFDVTRLRKIDLKGLNFIGSPGGSDLTFALNGFEADEESLNEIQQYSQELADGDRTIVLSHPDKDVDNLFYGHTHVRAADDKTGHEVPEGQYSPSLRFNPGAVSADPLGWGPGSAGLVTVNPERGIRYKYLPLN